MSTRSVIEKYMNHMFTGDFVAAFEMFAPEGRYTIIGDAPVSGTYIGPDHIKRDLLALLAERFISPPVVSCTDIIVEDNRGVALGFGDGAAKFGHYQQRNYAFAFKIDGDQVIEMIEFMDPNQLSLNCFGQTLSEPQPA
jgi:uncharacterized protein